VRITHDAVAGTLESGDVLVRVAPDETLGVSVSTSVEAQYGDVVRKVVATTLAEFGVESGSVIVEDKGALDCTLRARVQAAVARGTDEQIDWPALIGRLP